MIPRDWSPGVKWFGLYWPPAAWWFQGPWYYNHPFSHLIGGVGAAVLMRLADFTALQTLLLITVLGVLREETQVEDWSNEGGYPLYSAIGDAFFVVLGAVVPVVFL